MADFDGRTVFITGASRGIGRAIALRLAAEGARIALASRTDTPHPVLPGTIHDTAEEITAAGGTALPLRLDIRDAAAVDSAVARARARFGGIDIVVCNASAISLTGTAETDMKRFDLMNDINYRGSYALVRACLPSLGQSANPHILSLSPPPSLDPRWYGPHVAYTISKMNMSLLVRGWAEELRPRGIAANALWPRTVIDTAAIRMLGGAVRSAQCRQPDIVAEAARAILRRPARGCTGNFFIDDEVLAAEGVQDLSAYAVAPGTELMPDIFLPEAPYPPGPDRGAGGRGAGERRAGDRAAEDRA